MKKPGDIQLLFAPEGTGGGGSTPAAPSSPTPSAPSSAGGGTGSSEARSSPSGASPSAAPAAAPSGPASPSPSPAGPGAPGSPPGASPPVATPPGGPGDENVWDFAKFDQEDDEDRPTVEVPKAPSATPQTPPTTEAQPVPPAAAQPQPPEQPQQPPSGAPAAPPQPGPQAASPPSLPTDPSQLSALLRENAAAIEDQIAEQLFKLSPEDVEALDKDAGAHVPKLLARTYIRAQTQFLNYIGENLPKMIQGQMKVMERQRENEDAFYRTWPSIDRKHNDVVRETAYLYRQMNPQATRDKLISDIGPVVMLKLGIPITSPMQPTSTPSGQAAAPAAPGVARPQPSPFVPAQPGNAGIPQKPGPANPWEVNPMDMDED